MNISLRIFAGLIDFLQFMFFIVFFALQAITPVGGGVAGGAAAAYFCWNASTGVLSGLIAAGKCAVGGVVVGGVLSAFAGPIGMVIDFTLSVALGGALLLGLAYAGMFYFDIVLVGSLGELLPIFNFLPFWSNMVHRSIKRKNQLEGSGGGVLSTVMQLAPGAAAGGGVGALASRLANVTAQRYAPQGGGNAQQTNPERRANAPQLPQFNADIRPRASNNTPYAKTA